MIMAVVARRKLRKDLYARELQAEYDEKKAEAHKDYLSPLARLDRFEQGMVNFLCPNASKFFEKLHYDYSQWLPVSVLCDPPANPLQEPYTICSSMSTGIHRIFERVLEEHGALGQECRDVQRVQEIVRTLIRCIEDLEMASMEDMLEERGRKGDLLYQKASSREVFESIGHHKVA
ncbi:hypothetical protein VNI00_019085 [Paramarasmius palmivorus]|uniref:Uncharacterized protein n=1 Tax=Paramarasmius palmivorus TaxID=297713 RepID=A0AAW0ASS6_9AGAR